jgi:hypothetical protein
MCVQLVSNKGRKMSATSATGQLYGNAIINLHIVASRMTPEQIAEAQKLAHEWKRKLER